MLTEGDICLKDRIKLEQHILKQRRKKTDPAAIPCRPDTTACPASFAQLRMWMLEKITSSPGLYNISHAFRISGPIDIRAMQDALDALVSRHESLRTRFTLQGDTLMQEVVPHNPVTLRIADFRDSGSDRYTALEHFINTICREAFDLSGGCMMRTGIAQLKDKEFILAVSFHHIAADAWSINLLFREIELLYSSRDDKMTGILPDLRIRYMDYSIWQRQQLDGPKLDRLLTYWKEKLKGLVPLELQADRLRQAHSCLPAKTEYFRISPETHLLLKRQAQQYDVSSYMLLMAVFQLLLSRYSGQDDIAIGSPVAGRNHSDLENLVGLFVNTVVMRSDLGGNPDIGSLIQQVRETVLQAFANEELPFDLLVEEMHPKRGPGLNPFFRIMFAYYITPEKNFQLPGTVTEVLPLFPGPPKFDLLVSLSENASELTGSITYNADLYDTGRISSMAVHYVTLLDSFLAANPGTPVANLAMLSTAELELMTDGWNRTASEFPRNRSIHHLFEEQASLSPDAVALVHENVNLSYRDLNTRANRLSRRLTALGAFPGSRVGICLPRSIDMVIGVLAILKAGAAYVPIDPEYPASRIAFMLNDTGAAFVLSHPGLREKFSLAEVHLISIDDEQQAIGNDRDGNPAITAAGPESPACIMYTSGSTGNPKGVVVTHRNIVRLVFGTGYIRFGREQTFMLLAPLAFDASSFELWGSLLHGSRCVIYPDKLPTASGLNETITRHGVTTLWLTSSLFNAVIDENPRVLRGIRQLITGGEALSAVHVQRALAALPETELINGYGPTECTTFACCYRIPSSFPESGVSIPIGRPIANTRTYVLDPHMNPVPAGTPGELYIGGDGVTSGYWNLQELTRERFLADPFIPGENSRIYRTGDRVMYLADGNLVFLGRFDNQVKLRGFRIELEEIEANLVKLPSVREAVVQMREDSPGQRRLVAYIVPEGRNPDTASLRTELKKNLPDYMLPSAVVLLGALPLTKNGKTDRNALPPPEEVNGAEESRVNPRNRIEEQLFDIWKILLKTGSFGVRDNFFDIGGHSLLAVRMIDQIEKVFHRKIPLDTLWLSGGTIESLAEVLEGQYRFCINPELIEMKKGTKPPLFLVHILGGHLLDYSELVTALDPEQCVYGLQSRGVFGAGKPDMNLHLIAACCIESMRIAQPSGPYMLAGYSSGGVVAYEMAQQLRRNGEKVALLAMIDTGNPWAYRKAAVVRSLKKLSEGHIKAFRDLVTASVFRLFRIGFLPFLSIKSAHRIAHMNYRPEQYPFPVDFFIAQTKPSNDYPSGWKGLLSGAVRIHRFTATHCLIIRHPVVKDLAETLQRCLEMACKPQDSTAIPDEHTID
jgi:amino acid adenylation domain-containing protein